MPAYTFGQKHALHGYDFRGFEAVDKEKIVIESEIWTGPTTLEQWHRTATGMTAPEDGGRPVNKSFLSNFSFSSSSSSSSSSNMSRRGSLQAGETLQPRTAHYQTVSSTLERQQSQQQQWRSHGRSQSADFGFTASVPLPVETALPLGALPIRHAPKRGAVKRKPVPALALEDDRIPVAAPRWDPQQQSMADLEQQELERIGDRARTLSLEEMFLGGPHADGGTGLGFLVKEVDACPRSRRPFVRTGRTQSANSIQRSDSSGDTDSIGSSFFSPFEPASRSAASSASTVEDDSTHARLSQPFKPKSRPFALIRRRPSLPLGAYGTIIPSLAFGVKSHSKEDEDLVDAWMDIIVGKESPKEEEKPALVFQSRPRKASASTKSRPDSISSLAGNLPVLQYGSRRSSTVSLPSFDVPETWIPSRFDVREDSELEDEEEDSEEFHDANSYISSVSDHQLPPFSFQTLQSVPESPPFATHSSTATPMPQSSRFSPVFDRPNAVPQTLEPQFFQPIKFTNELEISSPSHTSTPPSLVSKRRHSRSASLDCSSSVKPLPPRPPKSARRLSKPDVALTTDTIAFAQLP
ncbi:uncharacterized protein JCM15063_000521 [Sporobolomyces koalae]|uniref:uncharacterized protein n=1 Tax=Sporobolomyces koalae TaxID=500713 RepID=UPI0031729E1E